MFKPMVGFQARLESRMLPDELVLPLGAFDVARIAAVLPDAEDYTRLWIGDAHRYEIVRVTGIVDGAVAIERSDEGTSARGMPPGTCISFVWTALNLADFIQQGMGGVRPAVCSVKPGSSRVSVKQNAGVVTIDRPECDGAQWRSGNQVFTQDDGGCVSAEPVASPIADGEYVNATVTVRDGQIVSIKSGTNIVYSGGGCCAGSGGN